MWQEGSLKEGAGGDNCTSVQPGTQPHSYSLQREREFLLGENVTDFKICRRSFASFYPAFVCWGPCESGLFCRRSRGTYCPVIKYDALRRANNGVHFQTGPASKRSGKE